MSSTALASAAHAPTALPDSWSSAPFSPAAAAELRALIGRLDGAQRAWLSGYLAGTLAEAVPVALAAPEAARPQVTVLFGSQTGNSERLARQLADALTRRGVAYTLIDMLECTKKQLQEAETLLLVVSTHGDGDPPERAVPFTELVNGRKAPRLEHLRYAVLALGDSSYEKFCATGRQLDARLETLGARRLHARADCDVDFEAPAREWIEGVLDKLEVRDSPLRLELAADRRVASVTNAYTRKNPFQAPVLLNQRLTGRGSSKDVRHIELSLEGSSIRYEPGDALGVVPRNVAADVDAVLAQLPFDPQTSVRVDAQTEMPLRQALTERFEIGPLSGSQLQRYAEASGSAVLAAVLGAGGDTLRRYVRAHHLVDLLAQHPPRGLDAAGFAQLLRPLAPRLYSIASSQQANPDEAHLTVSIVEYTTLARRRRGVVSSALAGLTTEEASVPVYLHRNPAFRLPTDGNTPTIMIGPGTGVAPFRAFLAERAAVGASGRNWLFFGDRSFESDFLYQIEWLGWRKKGVLTRLDAAFSRDQDEKVYVQQRLRERGEELWRWLEEGAHLYVCGDAERMAPDVHRVLKDVIATHGRLDAEQAEDYVLRLQQQRRYQRDVY